MAWYWSSAESELVRKEHRERRNSNAARFALLSIENTPVQGGTEMDANADAGEDNALIILPFRQKAMRSSVSIGGKDTAAHVEKGHWEDEAVTRSLQSDWVHVCMSTAVGSGRR